MAAFDQALNPHYDFNDPAHKKEIEAVDFYRLADDPASYSEGETIHSPWGTNRVLAIKQEDDAEICIKEITVKPGFMLSLQRHRGREEVWAVKEGTLTVILDGTLHEVEAGNSISIPKGAAHCMINRAERPVIVIETQRGVCREKDNIRLLDFNGRPTYPLTTEKEFESAKIYAQIQGELTDKFKTGQAPHKAWAA